MAVRTFSSFDHYRSLMSLQIYMSCRFFTLASCITVLTGFDIPVEFDCTVRDLALIGLVIHSQRYF